MKKYIENAMASAVLIFLFAGCVNTAQESTKSSAAKETALQQEDHHKEAEAAGVYLSEKAFKSLDMRVDTLTTRMLSGIIEANGQLEVPPQHEATVTAVVGANVTSIEVIEGDKVTKGKVLAYVAHPNLIKLQTDYVKAVRQLQFLEKQMQRQSRLYEAEVGAGKAYEETQADYFIQKASVDGLEAQLAQLHLRVEKIRKGDLYRQVPVVSPLSGYIEKVAVKVGEYVPPEKQMFKVINVEHVHADLMVFEKDVHQIAEGQTVFLTTESMPGKRLKAEIFAVGKKFEAGPRAVHIHAEIENKDRRLIPGMYIHGKIQTGGEKEKRNALPEEAIVTENGKPYIFAAEFHQEGGKKQWAFTKVEVRTGKTAGGWTEVKLLAPFPEGTRVAWNNAYYLISEMNKSEAGHHH